MTPTFCGILCIFPSLALCPFFRSSSCFVSRNTLVICVDDLICAARHESKNPCFAAPLISRETRERMGDTLVKPRNFNHTLRLRASRCNVRVRSNSRLIRVYARRWFARIAFIIALIKAPIIVLCKLSFWARAYTAKWVNNIQINPTRV